MWIIKAKGKTYYVEHVDADIPWTTKETPDNIRTKGAIKFKDCLLTIDEDNCASIKRLTAHDIARLRNQEQGITRIITAYRVLLEKILDNSNITHSPIKRYSAGCGTTWYVCDIMKEKDLTILGLAMAGKYRILMPNEFYYKWYDDPNVDLEEDYEDDIEDLYEE